MLPSSKTNVDILLCITLERLIFFLWGEPIKKTMDYKTNGSHGCINMPTKAAKKLYNMIEVGTPVHIKN